MANRATALGAEEVVLAGEGVCCSVNFSAAAHLEAVEALEAGKLLAKTRVAEASSVFVEPLGDFAFPTPSAFGAIVPPTSACNHDVTGTSFWEEDGVPQTAEKADDSYCVRREAVDDSAHKSAVEAVAWNV